MMYKQIASLILLTGLISLNGYAKDSPENIDNAIRVDAEKLVELAMAMPDMMIVDSRIGGDRKKGYIEGSISLPDIITDCKSLNKIIPETQTPVLFYCNGVKCGRSVVSIKIAQSCGYNKLYWFRGGFEEWLEKGLPYLQE